VKGLTGQNLTTVGWLTALPYLRAVGGLYLFGAWNDMTRNPKLCTVLSLIGFGLRVWLATLFPRHAWVSIALPHWFLHQGDAGALLGGFPSLLFAPDLSGGSRGIINALGNSGGFIGMRVGILGLSLLLGLSAGFTALLPRVTSQNSQFK
jgi:hypothetical protein